MPAAPDDPLALRRRALAAIGCSAAPLAIGGIPVAELARRFGTPFYAFDAGALAARVATVQEALGPRLGLLYSVKCNPSLAVTAALRAAGIGIEVASFGELQLARAAGHAPAAVRFAGPGKTDAEIDAAVAMGLGCFHVESASEVAAIAATAHRHGTRAGIAIRVNLPQQLAGARQRMGGRSSRFGVDAEQVPELLRAIARDPSLQLRGLHVYAGTQCFDADAFVAHATALVAQATQWEQELGIRLDELDLGGGFGIATYDGDPEFDLAAAGRGVQELVARNDRADRSWFVELGRFLCAPMGIYVTRAVRCKQSGGERHVALDGGLHHCAVAAGVGAVLKRAPLIVHAAEPFHPPMTGEPVHLGGPLCTPADQFGTVLLPEVREGDLLAVLHAGAYGATYSPAGFLSHPSPPELWIESGRARVARERGSSDDVLRGQMA